MSKLIHLCLHVHTHVHIFMLAWLGRSLQFFLNTVTALPWEAKISALEMCHSFLPNPPLWAVFWSWELENHTHEQSRQLLRQTVGVFPPRGNDSTADCTSAPAAHCLWCGPQALSCPMASGDGNRQGRSTDCTAILNWVHVPLAPLNL